LGYNTDNSNYTSIYKIIRGRKEMELENVLFDVKENGVATLTLNRPNFFNSFNDAHISDCLTVLEQVRKRDDIKVLVITGAGKAFSSGGDAGMLAAMKTAQDAAYIFQRSALLIKTVYELPKPVIAAVNGVAAGAATGFVLACDVIIASDKARFAPNFVNIAFVPDGGTSYYLFKKLGPHRAADILFTGRILNAQECLELDLVNRIVPHDNLLDEVHAYAERLAKGPSLTLKYMKEILRACVDKDVDTIAQLETGAQVVCWSSQDFRRDPGLHRKTRTQIPG
jgi:2-(1,2-epoxy-1,2-dihydrophenyl)acetyl-CoA isomerase